MSDVRPPRLILAVLLVLAGCPVEQEETDVDTEAPQDTGDDSGSTPNEAPSIGRVLLEPDRPAEGDTVSASLRDLVDPDGDEVTVEYLWTVNGVQVGSGPHIASDVFDKGDEIQVEVTPTDGEDWGESVLSAVVVAINSPPESTPPELGPKDARGQTDLICRWQAAEDPDLDELLYEVQWSEETRGSLPLKEVAGLEDLLPASETRGGERWTCVVTARDEDGARSIAETSDVIEITPAWSELATGTRHSCGIYDGAMYCWGENVLGVLGQGTRDNEVYESPLPVGTDTDWSSVSSSGYHTCGIRGEGLLYCWGNGTAGQLGDGTTEISLVPTRVGLRTDWVQVSAGGDHTCGITATGELYCWGSGRWGQLGQGRERHDYASAPLRVGSSTSWESVAAGAVNNCAIRESGSLYCWGNNAQLQVGIGYEDTSSFYPVYGPERVSSRSYDSVGFGYRHACALTSGKIYCWGLNEDGQLGTGTTSREGTPSRMGSASNWTRLAVGWKHSCAIDDAEQLFCWGNNSSGQLGDETGTARTSPWQVGIEYDWLDVWHGTNHTCGRTRTAGVLCWGESGQGQIAGAPLGIVSSPTALPDPA